MKKIVHKSAAPIYAAAVVWVLYALLFPLYRPGHFVIALAASAVVYGIARLFCKDIVEEVPQEPETTGNPELDQMIAQGKGALDEMPSAPRLNGFPRCPTRFFSRCRRIPPSCPRSASS